MQIYKNFLNIVFELKKMIPRRGEETRNQYAVSEGWCGYL